MWKGDKLLGGGQTPLWEFAHEVQDALILGTHDPASEDDPPALFAVGEQSWLNPGVAAEDNTGPIVLVVCEKFQLYPHVIYTPNGRATHALDWDEFRTVQLIGALTFLCQLYDVELHKQPASIKKSAVDAGAKEFFIKPIHDNRHTNDSIMHGFFYLAVECRGVKVVLPDNEPR